MAESVPSRVSVNGPQRCCWTMSLAHLIRPSPDIREAFSTLRRLCGLLADVQGTIHNADTAL